MPDPLAIADLYRRSLTNTTDKKRRSQLGQFFSPPSIARLMASMSSLTNSYIRFLDAGAGAGALTAAWVAEICSRSRRPKEVALTAVELDEQFLPELKRTFSACEKRCTVSGIHCTWEIKQEDFIEMAVHSLDSSLFQDGTQSFDVVMLNPPYKKLRSDSVGRSLLRRLGIETSNLYAAFVSLAVLLLKEGGELIAITPRSFCNGPYFRPFRRQLIHNTSLTHFHLFESRDQAFRDDEVLQENVIFRIVKGIKQHPRVLISQSHNPDDPHVIRNSVPFDQVVKKDDPQSFFHLIPDGNGHAVARFMESLPCTLADLGLAVSTGRVVDFRARSWLRMMPSADTVPLIYPTHFEKGSVSWPKQNIRKPNAIVFTDESSSLMVPSGAYTLVRRFSSKEERRRVVAAVFNPADQQFPVVGFENHLNYFHRGGRPLQPELARGLSAFLNSSLVDGYFRQFNGHTQVNAEDLKALHYPTVNVLIALGKRIGETLPKQETLDSIIEGIIRRNEGKNSGTAYRRSPKSVEGFRIAKGTAKREGRTHVARPPRSATTKTVG